jgi:hypothetical protein
MSPLRLLLVLLAAAFTVGGCSWQEADPEANVRKAREFDRFPLYWVGDQFEGLNLEEVDVQHDLVTLIYGDCRSSGGEQPSCAPPLQIQVSPICSHLAAVVRSPLWKRGSIRGAPVGTIDTAPVVISRSVQIKVYVGQGADPRLSLRALRGLRSANSVPPVIGPADSIPAPKGGMPGVLRACGVAEEDSGEKHPIDESAGRYRGVALGAMPDELTDVFGAKKPAGENEPLLPANVDVDDEDDGPSVIPYGSLGPAKTAAYRYKDVVFAFVAGRLRWLETIDPGAVTQRGVGIGDDLKTVEGRYPEATCGKAGGGDYYEYPACVLKLRPNRFIWFGGDPIRSITLSSLPLLGVTKHVPFRGQVFELTDGEFVTYPPGKAKAGDKIICAIEGKRISVIVPKRGAISTDPMYVAMQADGSLRAECGGIHAETAPPGSY